MSGNIPIEYFFEPHALVEVMFMVRVVEALQNSQDSDHFKAFKGFPFTFIRF